MIAAIAYFSVECRRKPRESLGETNVSVSVMKLHTLFIVLSLWVVVLPSQANNIEDTPSKAGDSPLVSELTVAQFSEVVQAIVQQTLEECAVEGDMKGKAKLNLDVTGDVTAKIVCKTINNTEEK